MSPGVLRQVTPCFRAKPLRGWIVEYESLDGTLHNSAAYLRLQGDAPAALLHVHRKNFLPTYALFDEERFVERGYGVRAFDTPIGRAALLVCEDAWHSLTGTIAALDGFREIGERFPIDVALLPIGAYDPPSLRAVHMNPEEALEAFVDLNASLMVPMHYGTFRLSYEPLSEPPERLRLAAQTRALQTRIAWMQEGNPVVF